MSDCSRPNAPQYAASAVNAGRKVAQGIVCLIAIIATLLFVPQSGRAQTTFEAENGVVTGATIVSDASASGGKYVDYTAVNQSIEFTTVNAASAGTRTMTIRFANGRPNNWNSGTDVYVNNVNIGTFWDFNTGGWTNWANGTFDITLNAGVNSVKLVARYDHSPNIDYVTIPGVTNGGGGTSIKINVGGGAVSPFAADQYGSGGTVGSNTNTIDTSAANSAPAAVYNTERYGTFSYTIPGLTSGSSYTVRLHFCENWFGAGNGGGGGNGSRLFNVAINGTTVLSNFDVHATAGGPRKALVQQFTATANGSGQVVIGFTNGSANNAQCNGIEVLSGGGGGSAPPGPTGLSATAGNAQVSLSWSASSGATSYNVKRSTTNGGPYSTVASPTGTSYTNTGLTNGTTYYYVVTAVNANGESGNSSQASATPTAPPASTANLMGINILGVSDYFEDRLFADAMKSCRDFTDSGGANVPVDGNGWPQTDFEVVVWHGISNMNGTHQLRFNGSATSVTPSFGSATISGLTYNSGTNTSTATLVYNSTDGSGLKLTFSGTKRTSGSATNTGVTNIQLMRPTSPGSSSSYAFGTLFTTPIQNAIAKFSVIRFMDYQATNSNNQVNWSDRAKPSDASQSRGGAGYGWQGRGGCLEYAIALANATNRDAWICVPAKATDAYVTNMARLIKFGSDGVNPYTSPQANPVYPPLNANLKAYIEYSNELWNTAGAFQQSFQNKDAAVAEVNAGGSPLNYDNINDSSGWQYAWRRIGKRGAEVSNLFRAVVGDADMMTRFRPVLMSQLGYANGPLLTALNFMEGYYNNPNYVSTPRNASYYFYGAGGSGYYNPDNSSDSLTLSNIWDSDSFNPSVFASAVQADVNMVSGFGMKRIAYEGGPSMDNTGHSESVKAAARDDSRMANEVVEHHVAWAQSGGDLLVYFNIAGDYQWGFTGSIFNLNTPKYNGIDTLNGQNAAAVTYGTLLPGLRDGNNWSSRTSPWGTPGTGSINMNTGNDLWATYIFRASSSANYNVRINYNGSGTLRVFFDGNLVGTINASSGTQVDSAAYAVSVGAGIHGVKVQCTSGNVTVNQVKVQ